MPIDLTTQEHPRFLQAILVGAFEPDAFLDACRRALSVAGEKKIATVLIDARQVTGERISTMDRFKVGETFAGIQRGFPFATRVAVLGNEPLVEPGRFGETVAVNRGAVGRVFTDLDEATNWLEGGDPTGGGW